MTLLTTVLFEERLSRHFEDCARFVVISAAADVCSTVRNLDYSQAEGLTPQEVDRLKTYNPAPELLARQTERVVQKFLSGQSGAQRLSAMSYRDIAQQAVRRSVTSYHRRFGIFPERYYRLKYAFLFRSLGLTLTSIARVDPSLSNDVSRAMLRRAPGAQPRWRPAANADSGQFGPG
jgi:hypothetical protein